MKNDYQLMLKDSDVLPIDHMPTLSRITNHTAESIELMFIGHLFRK